MTRTKSKSAKTRGGQKVTRVTGARRGKSAGRGGTPTPPPRGTLVYIVETANPLDDHHHLSSVHSTHEGYQAALVRYAALGLSPHGTAMELQP